MLINFNPINIHNNLKTAKNSSISPIRLNNLNTDMFQKSVSFGNNIESNEPSPETMKYIAERKQELKLQGLKPTSFKDYDLNKIEDILNGLTVFKNFKIFDVRIVSNMFDSILLQEGCKHGCGHCAPNANKNVKTMLWDNFEKLTEDIGTLTERLEFNPFEIMESRSINDIPTIIGQIYPYGDSDPMYYKSIGKDGKIHNIFDAAMLYYKKTKGTKFVINTNGWSKYNLNSQKAADSFVTNPECISSFGISVNPFDPLLIKSRERINQSITELDPGRAKKYREIGNRLRNKYIENMANTLNTSLQLPEEVERGITLLYAPKNAINCEGCSEKDSIEILKEILNKLKSENIDTSHFDFDESIPDLRIFNIEKRKIQAAGRAEQFFNKDAIREFQIKNKLESFKLPNPEISIGHAFSLPKFIDTNGLIWVNNSAIGSIIFDLKKIEDFPTLNFDRIYDGKKLLKRIVKK